MNDDRPNTFEKLLEDFKEARLTHAEFVEAFEKVVAQIKDLEDEMAEMFDKAMDAIEDKLSTVEKHHTTSVEEVKSLAGTEAAAIRAEAAQLLQSLQARISTIRDGIDADPEAVTQEVLKRIVIPTPEDVINGLPAFGERTRDSLELLPEGEKLAIDAIEGLPEELEKLRKRGGDRILAGGPHYLAGSGVSISGNIISATGSGALSLVTATGDVDDSNVVFTFSAEPTLVIVNGATYRDGKGATISGTSVTLDNPVGTGGDIYGLA